jgi:hypothetical protein
MCVVVPRPLAAFRKTFGNTPSRLLKPFVL